MTTKLQPPVGLEIISEAQLKSLGKLYPDWFFQEYGGHATHFPYRLKLRGGFTEDTNFSMRPR